MAGGRKRPSQFAGFSPFARSLLFSASASAHAKPAKPQPSASANPPQGDPTSGGGRMPPKRAKQPEPPSSDEEPEHLSSDSYSTDGEGDGDGDASEELQTVQADFAFFDPKPGDFHGVRLLLKSYLDSKPWDLTGFVDLILAQTTVGTVVKMADDEEDGEEEGEGNASDDDDLFGLITVLNLGRYGEHRCIKDLKEFLLAVCGDNDTKKKLRSLLEEKASSVGLLVCRRFVNFPYEIVPKLYDALFDEVSWATEDEPTKELQDSFRLKHYLLIVRVYERKNPAKQKAKNHKDEDEPIVYPKLEDEIFRKLCSWSFTFPLNTGRSAQQEMKDYKEMGLVMAVKAEAIPKFSKELEALVSEE